MKIKIQELLLKKKRELENRTRKLTSEDPFEDKTRLLDNAASDTEAREEVGHERIEALKNELSKNINLVKRALKRFGIGKYGICENCNNPISQERLKIFPEADLCISCEQKREAG